MSRSALIGTPPMTADDKIIAKAIKILSGSIFFPNKGRPYGLSKPFPNAPDQYDATGILAESGFFIAFITLITVGRFLIRWKANKAGFGLDDWFVLPAAATAITCNALVIWIARDLCYGHHIYFCTYEQFSKQYSATFTNQALYYPALYCSKLSLVFLLRRLTAFTQGWWSRLHWGILGLISFCGLFSIITSVVVCTPPEAHFNLLVLGQQTPKTLHCLNLDDITTANRGLHIMTDLILLATPIVILFRLQMPLRKKLSISFLFCFGIVCVIASIMRNEVFLHPSDDYTYDSGILYIWDILDISCGPIVASFPVHYPVINYLADKTYGLVSGKGSHIQSTVRELTSKIIHHDDNDKNLLPSHKKGHSRDLSGSGPHIFKKADKDDRHHSQTESVKTLVDQKNEHTRGHSPQNADADAVDRMYRTTSDVEMVEREPRTDEEQGITALPPLPH